MGMMTIGEAASVIETRKRLNLWQCERCGATQVTDWEGWKPCHCKCRDCRDTLMRHAAIIIHPGAFQITIVGIVKKIWKKLDTIELEDMEDLDSDMP